MTVFDLILPTMQMTARTHLKRGTRDAHRLAAAVGEAGGDSA